jgi:hypothetical protein
MSMSGIILILVILTIIIFFEEYSINENRTDIKRLRLSIDYLSQQIEELKKSKQVN